MGFPRVLAVFAAVTALIAGCGHSAQKPATAPASSSSAKPIPPAKPACGDPAALPAREKLAQLLMVGVRDGDDAKAVVTTYHVGGIFIGSWTDLKMLGPSLVKDLSASTALPVAVSVDEEGGRVARLSKLIGPAPSARVLSSGMPVPTPGVCATPGCCRCSSISRVTDTDSVTRTPGPSSSRRRCSSCRTTT
jgi:beta-N-acetylhexosaminidase